MDSVGENPGSRSRRHQLVVDEKTSLRLSRIRRFNTAPEQSLRAILREDGFHYRVENKDLPGSPDVANRSKRWAIFVNGCFWHHHRGCKRATVPRRNSDFWAEKFKSNRSRDARAISKLRALNFKVLVVWECELAARPERVPERIRKALRHVRGNRPS